MNNSIKRIFVLTKRNIKEIFRDPLSLVFTIGLPILMEILFYLLFAKFTDQFQMKYLAPGIIVFSQAFISLFVGLLISNDRSSSFLTRLYVSKAKSHEFIISYCLSIVPLIFVQSILFYVVGVIFDNSLLSINILYSILFSIVTSIFYIGGGVLIGSLCNEKSVGGIASIFISGQSLLSGMWFPIEGLDSTFINIMEFLPFRNATLLVQNALNGYASLLVDLVKPLVIILVYGLIVILISIFIFKKQMKNK